MAAIRAATAMHVDSNSNNPTSSSSPPSSAGSTPLGSTEDIGRRVLAAGSGIGCIGIVVSYRGMKEARIAPEPVLEGEIGDDIEALHKAKHYEKWTVSYGNGSVADLNVLDFTRGLHLFHNALTSEEVRSSLGAYLYYSCCFATVIRRVCVVGLTSEMLNAESNAIVKDKTSRAKLAKHKLQQQQQHQQQQQTGADTIDSGLSGAGAKTPAKGRGRPPKTPTNTIVLDEPTPILQCTMCGKVFKSGPGLKYHVQNVCMTPEVAAQRAAQEEERRSRYSIAEAVDASLVQGGTVTSANIVTGKRKRIKPMYNVIEDGESADEQEGAEGKSNKKRSKKRSRKGDDEDEDEDFISGGSGSGSDGSSSEEDDDDKDSSDDNVFSVDEGGSDDDVAVSSRGRRPPSTAMLVNTMNADCYKSLKASADVKRGYFNAKARFQAEPLYNLATSYIVDYTSNYSTFADILMRDRLDDIGNSIIGLKDWMRQQSAADASNSVRCPDINMIVTDKATGESCVLEPYQGCKTGAKSEFDAVFNAAGPVWTVAFAPHIGAIRDTMRYLAVSTTRIG
jgi:hypothetical protein